MSRTGRLIAWRSVAGRRWKILWRALSSRLFVLVVLVLVVRRCVVRRFVAGRHLDLHLRVRRRKTKFFTFELLAIRSEVNTLWSMRSTKTNASARLIYIKHRCPGDRRKPHGAVTPKVHVAWRNYIYLKTKKLELVAILALLFDRVKRTLHLLGQKAQSGLVSFGRQIFRLALRTG